jgi:hypothetical protein
MRRRSLAGFAQMVSIRAASLTTARIFAFSKRFVMRRIQIVLAGPEAACRASVSVSLEWLCRAAGLGGLGSHDVEDR